nr:MAG TPA: hypothetical protein [Caudoviricetes sp.]
MVAAGYAVHLYCDCDECNSKQWRMPCSGEYTGETWSECARQARSDGWSISKDRTRCYAPGHNVRRRR